MSTLLILVTLLPLIFTDCPLKRGCFRTRSYTCCWHAQLQAIPTGIYVSVMRDNITSILANDVSNDTVILKLRITQTGSLEPGAFRNAEHLRRLIITQNELVSLLPRSFEGASNLTYLDLSQNYIDTLHSGVFEGLSYIRILNLSNNDIESLPADIFRNFHSENESISLGERWLDLSHNRIKTIPSGTFEPLTSLNKLDLAFNQISSVSTHTFYGMISLKTLKLDSNPIQELGEYAFEGLVTLKHLSIRINIISNIESTAFVGLSNLTYFSLYQHELKYVSKEMFAGMNRLKALTVSQTTEILLLEDGAFANQKYLTTLELNELKLKQLTTNTFQGLFNLRMLSLKRNWLEELPEHVFQHLQNLNILDLRYNLLKNISRNTIDELPRLHTLYLHNNPLTVVDGDVFQRIQIMFFLGINANVASLFLKNVLYIKQLYLKGNIDISLLQKPSNLAFQGLEISQSKSFFAISALKLWRDLLRLKIEFSKLIMKINDMCDFKKLSEVFIYACGVTKLEPGIFNGLKSVKYIFLKGNKITEIQEGVFGRHSAETLSNCGTSNGLESLESLDLSRNKISHIHNNAFLGNKKLKILKLEMNEIINFEFLVHLRDLEKLSLVGNNLQTYRAEHFINLKDLKRLDIDDWVDVCDCELKKTWQLIRHYGVYITNTPYCKNLYKKWDDAFGLMDCMIPHLSIHKEENDVLGFLMLQLYVAPIILGLVFLLGIFGNTLLLIIFILNPDLRSGPNACIANLTVGDVLTLLINLPLSYIDNTSKTWGLGMVCCKLFMMTRDLSVGVSVYSVVALSLQRYLVTVRSMHHKTGFMCFSDKKTILVYITLVWCIAILTALPSLFSASLQGERCLSAATEYGEEYIRNIWTAQLVVYCVIPIVVISVTYIRVAMGLRKSIRNMPGETQATEQVKGRKRLAEMVVALTVVFCISYVPNFLIRVLIAWSLLDQGSTMTLYVSFISYCLFFSNTCFNPIMLYLMSSKFRNLFKKYLLFWRAVNP